jgi:replicative DNA helicase
MTTNKAIPADIEAEKSVLGSLLMNRDAIIAVAPWLSSAMFYLEAHGWIYEACLSCYNRRVPPDTRMVADELKRNGRLEDAGGYSYLSKLVDAVPTSYHVEHYARIVEHSAALRSLIIAGGKIAALGYDERTDVQETIANAHALLTTATARPSDDETLIEMAKIVDMRFAQVSAGGSQAQLGIPTGLKDFDQQTGGLHKSDLIIIAARPGVGKSSLALTIAYNLAVAGHRLDIFSLEMSKDQNLDRLIAMHTGINLLDARLLAMNDDGWARYMDALGFIHALPIAVDDQPALTLHDLRTRLLRRQATMGAPTLVIVDYLGLMRVPKSRSRYDEVSEIARGLKNLAKEMNVPVLALCQMSRAVEERPGHLPMLSDLRESGELEQAADLVAFIYREEMHDSDTDKRGVARLIIAKHRHGALGTVPLHFDKSTTRFTDLSYRQEASYAHQAD